METRGRDLGRCTGGGPAGCCVHGLARGRGDLMALMDVFVLPSWREGLPRSAVEAAASGLPQVLTDIRGCREVVRDGVEGARLVRGRSGVGERDLTLLEDPDARRVMGRAARARAEELFDERRVNRTVVMANHALLARRRRGTVRASGYDDLKRAFDVAVAGTGLVVLSPVIGAVAVAVRLGLGRPVLFRQVRPGLYRRHRSRSSSSGPCETCGTPTASSCRTAID